ncbi:MAG: VOC family protein [Thiobacillus sp.]|nr:VOC family protein [Thiobacillus sp.]
MGNPFVHIELHTADISRAKDFYTQLFDWTLEEIPVPGAAPYTMIKVGEGTGGGIFETPDPTMPPHWTAYVDVDDIRSSTDKARSLGATVLQDVTQVGAYGWFSIIQDPTGAVLALWKTADETHPDNAAA